MGIPFPIAPQAVQDAQKLGALGRVSLEPTLGCPKGNSCV